VKYVCTLHTVICSH